MRIEMPNIETRDIRESEIFLKARARSRRRREIKATILVSVVLIGFAIAAVLISVKP